MFYFAIVQTKKPDDFLVLVKNRIDNKVFENIHYSFYKNYISFNEIFSDLDTGKYCNTSFQLMDFSGNMSSISKEVNFRIPKRYEKTFEGVDEECQCQQESEWFTFNNSILLFIIIAILSVLSLFVFKKLIRKR